MVFFLSTFELLLRPVKSIRKLGTSVQNSTPGHNATSGPLAVVQGGNAVAIVDDNERAHILIREILDQTQDFLWVASYFSGEAALIGIPQSGAQIVLMDIKMPGMSGIECTKRLMSMMPCLKIVMMTGLDDSDSIDQSLSAGAVDYLIKPHSVAQCLATLKSAACGKKELEQKALGFEQSSPPAVVSAARSLLTEREIEVIKYFAKGYEYKEVAHLLGITYATVHYHQHQIYEKLGVHNRTEAISKIAAWDL